MTFRALTPRHHPMSLFRFGVGILLLAGTSASAQQASCQGTTCVKYVTVQPGKSVILAHGINSVRSMSDCTFVTPNIRTIVHPRVGRVVPSVVPYVIPATSPFGQPTGACAGTTTKGLRITYVANGDASGSDEVVLKVDAAGGASITSRYVITIQ